MTTIHRRDFLKGCCASAIAGAASPNAFGAAFDPAAATDNTLVVLFLRGGTDGLSLVPPVGGNDRATYEQLRPTLKIPLSGAGAALPLPNTNGLWGLHPRATALQALYQSNHLAVVLGAGQVNTPVTRSHFDSQANMEFGLGGQQGSGVGWLTRHLISGGLPANVPIPSVCMGAITSTSLLSSTETITAYYGSEFRLDTAAWAWNARDNYAANDLPAGFSGFVETLPQLWAGSDALEVAGQQTLDALAAMRPLNFRLYNASSNPGGYQPAGGANYGDGALGTQLRNIAQMIKAGLGLRIATVDYGGWDTHDGQGNPANTYDYFGNKVQELSDMLGAFYTDLSSGATNHMQKVSVLVMSEFGRRVNENESGGTDHGYGNVMLALGASVNGGRTYGTFPGLASAQLYEGADVAVTTDYRRVISEALVRRLGNPNVYYVFPGYSGYSPLGIFQGSDQPPGTYDQIFKNGFQ
ncbi:DUF1501 domain-containing protein [Tahibacter amnicola]|uniref:DUF1501 domain-containing protein n=1 Tax=Tahibacter amnicola TaxID=2976241 RepID=A0ABY6BMH2_9GAMM|nr:DUF1501 domain-containing protein [Tahibacter amnicola]UXI69761.1 DUF1501 domain-containing protein [Tahibacter amnicola]